MTETPEIITAEQIREIDTQVRAVRIYEEAKSYLGYLDLQQAKERMLLLNLHWSFTSKEMTRNAINYLESIPLYYDKLNMVIEVNPFLKELDGRLCRTSSEAEYNQIKENFQYNFQQKSRFRKRVSKELLECRGLQKLLSE